MILKIIASFSYCPYSPLIFFYNVLGSRLCVCVCVCVICMCTLHVHFMCACVCGGPRSVLSVSSFTSPFPPTLPPSFPSFCRVCHWTSLDRANRPSSYNSVSAPSDLGLQAHTTMPDFLYWGLGPGSLCLCGQDFINQAISQPLIVDSVF